MTEKKFDLKHYQPVANCLAEKIILINGASGAIGSNVAKACASYGATVILLGRKQNILDQVYDEIAAAGYPQAAVIAFNFETASEQAYQQLAQTLQQEFGRLDGLVHCSASLGNLCQISLQGLNTWHKTLGVNLHAPFLLTQNCWPLLANSAQASVVFCGDTKKKAYWGAYGVAKAGLMNLMEICAAEGKSNDEAAASIRSNGIIPGATKSKLRRDAYPAEDESLLFKPDHWNAAFIYLLSEDSKNKTGVSLDFSTQATGQNNLNN